MFRVSCSAWRVLPVGQVTPPRNSELETRNSRHCRSYSPLPSRLNTLKPAFLASVTESGLSLVGVLNAEKTLRTGFLQAGQCVSGFADNGRFSANRPPHAGQLPSHSSYS